MVIRADITGVLTPTEMTPNFHLISGVNYAQVEQKQNKTKHGVRQA